jgi:DNA sulfur modification protein DndD
MDFTTEDDNVHHLSLMQMPNGTGKTTTLRLIRAALSGSPLSENWSPAEIKMFKPYHHMLPENMAGEFRLAIKCETEHGTSELTFILEFDWTTDAYSFKTKDRNGTRQGYDPPAELRRLLKKEFLPFLIFDVELAHEELFDRTQTRADDAINALFQLNVFDRLNSIASDYFTNQISDATNATTDQGIAALKTRIDNLSAQYERMNDNYTKHETELNNTLQKVQNLENAYKKEIDLSSRMKDERNKAQSDIRLAEKNVETVKKHLMVELRKPHQLCVHFGETLLELKSKLDIAKLPSHTSSNFFVELAELEECICGRKLDKKSRSHLIDQKDFYLEEASTGETNRIKTAISREMENDSKKGPRILKDVIVELKGAEGELSSTRTKLDQLNQSWEEDNPRLVEISEEISQLHNDVNSCREAITIHENDRTKDRHSRNPFLLKEAIQEEQHRLSEMTGQVQLAKKTDKLKAVLQKSAENSRKYLSTGLLDNANNLIRDILPDNYVTLGNIDGGALTVNNRAGMSKGEEATLGYAFLMTLFDTGSDLLPFIVDSPATPLDASSGYQLSKLLVKSHRQFIGFMTSRDKVGFIDGFIETKDVRYSTHFRDDSEHWSDEVKDNNEDAIVTGNGVSIYGLDFFKQFQSHHGELISDQMDGEGQ